MTETRARTGPSEAPAEFRNCRPRGPFAPADREVTVYDVKVAGSIPEDLDGCLLRAGPDPADPENPA